MRHTVTGAEAGLEGLIDAALRGEDVVIQRDDGAAVRMVPVARKPFRMGILQGQLGPESLPDFFEPMSEEDLLLWEGGGDDPQPR